MKRKEVATVLACLLMGCGARAEEATNQTGQFQAVFHERDAQSALSNIVKRMDEKADKKDARALPYKIEEETYSAYVPADYKPDTPYGLVVWVNAQDGGGMRDDWKPVMDKYKLIWVGANKSGNDQGLFLRRIPLALDAVYNMTKRYNISSNRTYIAGYSGGGRTASRMAMHYPDVFAGGVFVDGVDYWETIPETNTRSTWTPGMTKPKPRCLAMANQRGRYVLLTGDKDMNLVQTGDYYKQGYKKKFRHVLYLQVPGMEHTTPPPEWWEKAIVFLETAASQTNAPTRRTSTLPRPATPAQQ
jgi:predicted esterase